MNFGQLYGEVVINDPESFLLPHSSLLSLVVFIGIVPLIMLFVLLAINLIKSKKNYEFVLISTYVLINIIKNDSINYLVVFVFYSLTFLILQNRGKSVFSR